MKCPKCDGVLKRNGRSCVANPVSKTAEVVCSSCKMRWTIVIFLSHEADGYGKGAYATASKIKQGKKAPALATREKK